MPSLADIVIISGGALLAGFVSGFAGFGTGLVALGIWLYAASPAQAAALVMITSVVSQALTIRTIWHALKPRQLWPIITAGLAGVPVGTVLLANVSPDRFRLAMGIVLLVFSVLMAFGRSRPHIERAGPLADAAVGFGGGILGGFAGLSGPLPIMWAALRGWDKERRRALFQSYNLSILLASFIGVLAGGLITSAVVPLVLCALPGTLLGAFLGARAYHRASDGRFDAVVLLVLAFSGLNLIWSAR